MPFLFLRSDAFDNDNLTCRGWKAMGAGRLIFFGVVAIERRLIRWKFYNDVAAARLPAVKAPPLTKYVAPYRWKAAAAPDA